ncbi:glycosyltransferase family 39 protein [Patescibacteria group bacterium]|nr:glycosyltransferase family 39 protein [Patescibacteria group bacterium]MBU1931127.1 glycosyltransferase family 39 protein [Patescibacteria group bacterium]
MKIKKRVNLFITLIIAANLLLRLPALWEPTSYGDECIYLALGQALRKGLVFYRDIHDNKPPLLYLIAGLAGGKLFYFRIVSVLWNTLNIWLIALLTSKLTKKPWAPVLTAGLFLIFSLLPEGWVANGELFMIMPATLGVYLALIAQEKKSAWPWFASGFCFSLAFLFKIPVAFDFAGFFFALLIFKFKGIKSLLQLSKQKWPYLLLAGFVLPIALSIVYYAQKGAFTPYVRSALMQNIGYLSSWNGGGNNGLYQRAFILVLVTALIYRWRQQLGFSFVIISLTLGFSLYGVFLSERPYPHYLIEAAPWAALTLGLLLTQINTKKLIITTLLTFLILAGVNKFNFWWYPIMPYYRNFIDFALLGKISQQQYFRYFGQASLDDYQLAKELKSITRPDEPVFIWGDSACAYALSERIPVGRYTVAYHIKDFDAFNATLQALEKHQPTYIIKLNDEHTEFPQLDAFLASHYVFSQQLNRALVYHRISP